MKRQQRDSGKEAMQLTFEDESFRLSGIFLRKDHTYRRVPLEEIILLEACQNYTLIYTVSETFLYSRQLNKVAQRLHESFFMRVHRSYVVNRNFVLAKKKQRLELTGNRIIPIGKTYRNAFQFVSNAVIL